MDSSEVLLLLSPTASKTRIQSAELTAFEIVGEQQTADDLTCTRRFRSTGKLHALVYSWGKQGLEGSVRTKLQESCATFYMYQYASECISCCKCKLTQCGLSVHAMTVVVFYYINPCWIKARAWGVNYGLRYLVVSCTQPSYILVSQVKHKFTCSTAKPESRSRERGGGFEMEAETKDHD